jgi:hypothetical protein
LVPILFFCCTIQCQDIIRAKIASRSFVFILTSGFGVVDGGCGDQYIMGESLLSPDLNNKANPETRPENLNVTMIDKRRV